MFLSRQGTPDCCLLEIITEQIKWVLCLRYFPFPATRWDSTCFCLRCKEGSVKKYPPLGPPLQLPFFKFSEMLRQCLFLQGGVDKNHPAVFVAVRREGGLIEWWGITKEEEEAREELKPRFRAIFPLPRHLFPHYSVFIMYTLVHCLWEKCDSWEIGLFTMFATTTCRTNCLSNNCKGGKSRATKGVRKVWLHGHIRL